MCGIRGLGGGAKNQIGTGIQPVPEKSRLLHEQNVTDIIS